MANQISIESLELTNFGPFYDHNVIDFKVDKRRPPHVLIGGQNGAGKTHLLRALYLGVAGRVGMGDLKDVEANASGATKFNLDHLLNRRARREGADTCSVRVKILQRDADSGKERTLTLHRDIHFRPNSAPNWISWAESSDNKTKIEDGDMIERLRDVFMPRVLARFFFFDAEKSQNFQLGEKDILEGISRILGLWSYEQLEEHLRTVYAKANSELTKDGASNATAKLATASGEVTRLKGEIQGETLEIKRITTELLETEAELLNIEDRLKTIGAIDPKKLSDNQSSREAAATAKAKLVGKLQHAWELALPVELLGDLRAKLAVQLDNEQRRRNWEDRRDAVAPQLPIIQGKVFSDAPAEFALPDDTLSFYAARLEKALKGLFEPPPEGVDTVNIHLTATAEAGLAVRQLLSRGADGLADIAEASQQLELIEADVARLDLEIRQQMHNTEAIGAGRALHEQRGALQAKAAQLKRDIGDREAKLTRLEQALTEQIGLETQYAGAVALAEKGRSLATRASAYRVAAGELRKRASDRMRSKINEKVGDLWLDIMGRRREFSGMMFDAHWGCHLVRKNGEKVPWDDLNTSAGQRQVRLLAFYEALRRLAQSVPPLVVDTPLGRLDKEVRDAVLSKLYLSDDGHQSIVLSTNAEIDPEGELFAKMRYRFGKAYTLIPHGKPDSEDYEVEIQPHYFDRKVTL
ncbi:MAG: AAA family ATPase [Undibacterium sp.]|nr:AAA family ATPase [Opitutaceae bacterium]